MKKAALLAVAVAVAVAGATAYLVWSPSGGGSGVRYRDSETGWSISVPTGFHLRRYSEMVGLGQASGVTIANFDAPDDGNLAGVARAAAKGVFIEISTCCCRPVRCSGIKVPLPLSLASLVPREATPEVPMHDRSNSIEFDGIPLGISVQIGDRTSPADRHQADEIMRSLHFPRTTSYTPAFDPYRASETILMQPPSYRGRVSKFDAGYAADWAARVSSNPVLSAARRNVRLQGSYEVTWRWSQPFVMQIIGYGDTPRAALKITAGLSTAFTTYMHRLYLREPARDRWQFVTKTPVKATKLLRPPVSTQPQPY